MPGVTPFHRRPVPRCFDVDFKNERLWHQRRTRNTGTVLLRKLIDVPELARTRIEGKTSVPIDRRSREMRKEMLRITSSTTRRLCASQTGALVEDAVSRVYVTVI